MTRVTRVSLAHRTVIALLTLLVSGLGLYVTGLLKQELIPSMDLPRASIIAVYPGASSEVVERDVSKPLEAAVKAVNGVTRVTSVSSSGVSQVKAEWDYGTKADKVVADIRTAVDGLKAALPTDVVTRVSAGSLSDIPVMILSVSSDSDAATLAADVRGTVALVPMGLGVTGGSVFISKPLAIVVIGGLVSSTVLTLVLVPVLYDLLEKARARWSERRGLSTADVAEGEPV